MVINLINDVKFNVKPFDAKYSMEFPYIILATSEYVSRDSNIMVADFRDTEALYMARVQAYIGIHHSGALLIGSASCMLRNGIWYTKFDESVYDKYRDINPLEAVLHRIISD